MNLKSIASKVRHGEVSYALGRFKTVRVSYSALRKAQRALRGNAEPSVEGRPTLFPNTNVQNVIRTIREDAVFVGLKLPPHTVREIEAFARSEPLHAIYDPEGPTFRYSDVTRGQSIDRRPMPIGGIREPTRCAAVREVVEDPVLRAIIRGYLGYEPSRVVTLLDWSFASNFTDEERRKLKHHVIDYHYDVGGFNFVYTSFYITDTDRYSGAHTMMKRSHNHKPLRMLLGSTVASEDRKSVV